MTSAQVMTSKGSPYPENVPGDSLLAVDCTRTMHMHVCVHDVAAGFSL